MIKKVNFMKFFLTFCVFINTTGLAFAQTESEFLEAVEAQIASQILQETEYEYYVSAYTQKFNPTLELGFYDSYNTLEESYVFIAMAPVQDNGVSPKGFIGIFRDGNILWKSEKRIKTSYTVHAQLFGVLDLNNDGKIDLITQWYQGMRGGNTDLWIYSWDGSAGELISDAEEGESRIQVQDYTLEIVDFESDGVKEIIGTNWSDEPIVYSWNGQLYLNQNKVKPNLLPRDGVEIDLSSKISLNNGLFEYSYSLRNQITSTLSLEDFYLEKYSDNIFKVIKPSNWDFFSNVGYNLIRWHVDPVLTYHREALVEPGITEDSLKFSSNDFPKIVKFYTQGNNGDLDFGTENLFKNSFSGYTLGPWLPESSISLQGFTDTLQTFRSRACEELDWANDTVVCNQLEGHLNDIENALTTQDTLQAAIALQDFIDLVQAEQNESLTSEGFALLYYNARYLATKLPEPSSSSGSGITCGCENPVTQSSGTITIQNGDTQCLNTSFSGSVFFESGGALNVCSVANLQNIYGNQPGQINVSETGDVSVGNWNNNYAEDRFTNWGMTTFNNWTTVNNGTLTNYGEIEVNGGLNQNNGSITNHGQLSVSNALNINTTGSTNSGFLSVGGRFTINNGSFDNECRMQASSIMLNGLLQSAPASSISTNGMLTINSNGELTLGGNKAMLSVGGAMLNGKIHSIDENLFVSQNTVNFNSGAVINSTGQPLYVVAPNFNNLSQNFTVGDGSLVVMPATSCNPQGYNTGN